MVSRRLGDPDFHTWLGYHCKWFVRTLLLHGHKISSCLRGNFIITTSGPNTFQLLTYSTILMQDLPVLGTPSPLAERTAFIGIPSTGGSMQAHAGDEASSSFNRRVGNLGSQPTWRVLLEEYRTLKGYCKRILHKVN